MVLLPSSPSSTRPSLVARVLAFFREQEATTQKNCDIVSSLSADVRNKELMIQALTLKLAACTMLSAKAKPCSLNTACGSGLISTTICANQGKEAMSRIFDVDTNLWRTFKSVSETRSITRSAALLCKTPPAVSMQIKKLEELLELQLFLRGDQRFKLTPMGEEVLLTAEKILVMNDNLFSLKDKVGSYELRLGLPDDYSLFFLHDIIKSLKQLSIAIHINVICKTSEPLLKDIEQDLLDLAIIATREGQHLKSAEHIRFEELCWIGDKELINPGQPIPLVHFPQGCVCRDISINSLKNANIEAHVGFTSDSNFSVFNAINAGVGIGLSERSFVPKATPIIYSSMLPALPRIEISTVANTQRIPNRVLEQISSSIQTCVNKSCEIREQKANVAPHTSPNMIESLMV